MPLIDVALCAYINIGKQGRVIYAAQSPHIEKEKDRKEAASVFVPELNFFSRKTAKMKSINNRRTFSQKLLKASEDLYGK
jgi:hypothetical protein